MKRKNNLTPFGVNLNFNIKFGRTTLLLVSISVCLWSYRAFKLSFYFFSSRAHGKSPCNPRKSVRQEPTHEAE